MPRPARPPTVGSRATGAWLEPLDGDRSRRPCRRSSRCRPFLSRFRPCSRRFKQRVHLPAQWVSELVAAIGPSPLPHACGPVPHRGVPAWASPSALAGIYRGCWATRVGKGANIPWPSLFLPWLPGARPIRVVGGDPRPAPPADQRRPKSAGLRRRPATDGPPVARPRPPFRRRPGLKPLRRAFSPRIAYSQSAARLQTWGLLRVPQPAPKRRRVRPTALSDDRAAPRPPASPGHAARALLLAGAPRWSSFLLLVPPPRPIWARPTASDIGGGPGPCPTNRPCPP